MIPCKFKRALVISQNNHIYDMPVIDYLRFVRPSKLWQNINKRIREIVGFVA